MTGNDVIELDLNDGNITNHDNIRPNGKIEVKASSGLKNREKPEITGSEYKR